MVAKITSGSTLYGALAYHHEKVDEQQAKVLYGNRMMLNQEGDYTLSQCLRSFEPYLENNIQTKNVVFHVSLNPHKDDKLGDEQLSHLAQTYMEQLGYGDQPYIVYKHEDIDRHHIHIVSVRVDEQGKKINDSFEHRRSKEITMGIEQEYGLIPADQKQQPSEAPVIRPVNYHEGDVKKQIGSVARTLSSNYHFSSITEFKALLSCYNIALDEVKGEGFHGIIYSALDEKGNKVGVPLKSSSISKGVGMEALQSRMNRTQALLGKTNIKDRTKGIIVHAVEHCKGERNVFEKHLAKNDISVLFRANAAGRIYGATFVDHQTKLVLNGSRMGKEYSANVFEELFNGLKVETKPTLDNNKELSVMESKKLDTASNTNTNLNHELDLSFLNLGTDVEQEIFASRLEHEEKKRQRKRGRRM